MDEEVMQLLKPLAEDLQKVIDQLESRSADEKTESAPKNEAASEDESKKEQAENKPTETDKEQQERNALREKKERARLLQKLDLISL